MKRSELEVVLEGLVALRAKAHYLQVNEELKSGQPQFPIAGVLEKLDQTINLLTKEVYATKDRTPKTLAQKFNMFVGFKL
jgi:hypothetical protein